MRNALTKTTGSREEWIDFIKVLCVMFIVCAHAGYPISVSGYYYVPVFFITAGYVFKDNDLFSFIWNKIKKIYIPFIIANVIYSLLHNLLYITGQMNTFYTWQELIKNFWEIIRFNIPDLLAAPTWFLFALFVTNIEFMLLFKLSSIFKKYSKLILGIMCIVLYFIGIRYSNVLNEYIWGNCAILTILFITMIFYYIGYMIKSLNIKKLYDKKDLTQIISIIVSVIVLMIAKYHFNYDGHYRAGIFSNGILALVIPVAGLVFLTFVSEKIIPIYKGIHNLFKYIGKNTIYILSYHPLFFQIVGFIQIHLGIFTLQQINTRWINIEIIDNWCFPALILGISLPIVSKYLIDKLKFKLVQKRSTS